MQARTQNWVSPIPADRSPYVVDGLALGDPVAPKSAAYREYLCRPSEQFAPFIWCKRRKAEKGKFGDFTSVNSILHSQSGATVYISRYIEPAFFRPGDIDSEIGRLSERFGSTPHVLKSPRRAGEPAGIVAYWGGVTFRPLDSQSLAELSEGRSVSKGMLFDFLGNFGHSASAGFPVYQLGGSAGYVWGAHFDESGRGALRMTAIDASQFAHPSVVARGSPTDAQPRNAPAPAPAPAPKVDLSSGSGFFVSNEGHVLTNNHVIEDCASITVFMEQAEPVEGRPIARDAVNDLALLSTALAPPRVASPRSGLRLGESLAAFGYPHADILATSGNFTQGNVTALAGVGDDSRYVQISAPVQAGNSGGPLLDQKGNLVGVVSSKLNALKIAQASGDLVQNVNFALKASIVANFLDTNRIKYVAGSAISILKSEDLADQARSMSVFILCK